MILGIGNDIIDIRRIEKTLERFGDRFVQRLFTDTEQKRSERRKLRAASYAKRFAAKEACSKALGHRPTAGCVLARYGRHQSAIGQADHDADQ
jgi:holo-[acyl-carrier-protein] synthase